VTTGSDGSPAPAELAARAWGLFRELLRYLDARTCRHDFVLRYFGDEQELLGGCGHCDVCQALDGAEDETPRVGESEATKLIVQKALSGVARARERGGLVAVAEMLRGADSEKMRRFRFNELSTFGLLKEYGEDWVVALLRAMIAAGWIDLTATDHPVPFLTRSGVDVMRGAAPARIVLPAREARPPPSHRGERGERGERTERAKAPELDESLRPLFERLRAHRAEVARERRVPAYVVAFDRTLLELAARQPRTSGELHFIYGMGPARIEQYGEGFLRVIAGC
jgi:ATP-dependent DNA helicase RecQ